MTNKSEAINLPPKTKAFSITWLWYMSFHCVGEMKSTCYYQFWFLTWTNQGQCQASTTSGDSGCLSYCQYWTASYLPLLYTAQCTHMCDACACASQVHVPHMHLYHNSKIFCVQFSTFSLLPINVSSSKVGSTIMTVWERKKKVQLESQTNGRSF